MRQIGQSYKRQEVNDSYDVIVIGSGIGGLTAAALLAKHGKKKALVLERHYTAGGFTHVFRRPGYEWDVGVHYIGELNQGNSVRSAFDYLTEGRLEWHPMPDVYDRIVIGEGTYDFPSGRERFRQRMKKYFPNEGSAIDRYIHIVEDAARASQLYFADKALPAPMSFLAGGLMRRKFLRYSDRTTAEVLSDLTNNKELIAVLTGQWGDYGLPPARSSFGVHALVARHYFGGAAYPVGGASEIAAGIAPLIEREGGQILVSAEVTEILLDQAGRAVGVKMADGREFHAKTIISDAGAYNTFAGLLSAKAAAGSGLIRKIKALPASMSHLCLYVGLKRREGEPEFEGTNLWVYPGPDHDSNVAKFAENPDAPFPVVFISFPSSKDPAFAQKYPDSSTIEVVAPAHYSWFEQWADQRWKKRGEDYDALKERFAERLRNELELNVPAAHGRIDFAELSTPLSTRHFANYQRGEIYGLTATPERFRIKELRATTPIKNLYLTGQDVTSLGVTGALFGGVVCASAVFGKNLMSAVTRTSSSYQLTFAGMSGRKIDNAAAARTLRS